MPYARKRAADDIAAILEASEVDHTGHAISRHADIDDTALLKRVVGENLELATRFSSRTDLISATLEVMNSPAGQAKLGELDTGSKRTAIEAFPVTGNYFADTEWGESFRFPAPEDLGYAKAKPGQSTSTRGLTVTAHQGSQRKAKVTKVTVVLKVEGSNLRIVTSYPCAVAE